MVAELLEHGGGKEGNAFIAEGLKCPPEYGYWPNANLKLFITRACDLSCPGCFNRSDLRTLTDDNVRAGVENLSEEQIASVLKEARASFNTHATEFSGGEPTLRPETPNLIATAKTLGFATRLTTNGTLLGAYGPYRDQLVKFLPEDLKNLSAEEMVDKYISSGLDRVTVSVDNMHTMDDSKFRPANIISARAPVSVVVNTLQNFLNRGFGYPRNPDSHTILDDHGLRVSMTASGKSYEPSKQIVEQVMAGVGAVPVIIDGQKLPKLWKTKDGQEIHLHRNETADIGYATKLNLPSTEDLQTIFSKNCFDFRPRSASLVGNGINQEIAINYDGQVYNCAMQSYAFGDIRQNSLSEIVQYVNEGTAPEQYRVGSEMFMEIMQISKETNGRSGWGEAYRRILEMDPSLKEEVLDLRTHSGLCNALGHSSKYLDLLKKYRSLA